MQNPKEHAKHIVREILEHSTKYETTEKQRGKHALRLVQSSANAKVALGTLKEGVERVQYELDLLTAVRDTHREVIQEKLDSLERQIEEC